MSVQVTRLTVRTLLHAEIEGFCWLGGAVKPPPPAPYSKPGAHDGQWPNGGRLRRAGTKTLIVENPLPGCRGCVEVDVEVGPILGRGFTMIPTAQCSDERRRARGWHWCPSRSRRSRGGYKSKRGRIRTFPGGGRQRIPWRRPLDFRGRALPRIRTNQEQKNTRRRSFGWELNTKMICP